MFKGRIRVDELRRVFAVCLAINGDHKIIISQNGWKTGRTDSSNVCMAIINFGKELFENYQLDENELSVGLDVKKLFPIFPTGKTEKFVDIKFDNNTIELIFTNYRYTLSGLALNYLAMDVNKLETAMTKIISANTCKFTADCNSLKENLNLVKKISDSNTMFIAFENSNHVLKLLYNEDAGEAFELIQSSNCEGCDARSIYGGDYVIPLIKELSDYNTNADCSFGDNRPICWEINKTGLNIKVAITPRIPPKND